jgi:uncharacterized membrane protein YedE/YeeE
LKGRFFFLCSVTDMENAEPLAGLLGGAMIGLAAALFLLLQGRIAGISGIVGGLVPPQTGDVFWRMAFVLGLVLGPLAAAAFGWAPLEIEISAPYALIIAGGFLVGFGTRLGSGCTSGHGVCGLARASRRSILATAVFFAAAAATVFLLRHVFS